MLVYWIKTSSRQVDELILNYRWFSIIRSNDDQLRICSANMLVQRSRRIKITGSTSSSPHLFRSLPSEKMSSILVYQRVLLISVVLALAWGQLPCPVEEDPVQLAECAQLDVQAIIQAAKGNLKLFCNLAERYMECFKTKTRNCIGGWVNEPFPCWTVVPRLRTF